LGTVRNRVGDLCVVEIEGDHIVSRGKEPVAHRPTHVSEADESNDVAVDHVFPIDVDFERLAGSARVCRASWSYGLMSIPNAREASACAR
jgi:hypothetical protein